MGEERKSLFSVDYGDVRLRVWDLRQAVISSVLKFFYESGTPDLGNSSQLPLPVLVVSEDPLARFGEMFRPEGDISVIGVIGSSACRPLQPSNTIANSYPQPALFQ